MTNSTDHPQLSSLTQILKHCQSIRDLLQDDQKHFSTNKLNSLETNNLKKAELLNKLNNLLNDMQVYSATYGQQSTANSAATLQASSQKIMAELKAEIAVCYKYIVTNSHVIVANLQQLKEIWDKLSAFKSGSDCVYDKNGSITK
ncbi:MAG: hypothetical protein ABI597_01435 [Gammaproteobacteria bacterium]